MNITTTLTASFDQYSKKLENSTIDIGFQNPYIYVLASEFHEAVAMALKGKDGDRFRGIIITKSDSPLRTLDDLMDKKIAIVSYTAAGGYLSQKLSMQEHGIDVDKDCTLEVSPDNKHENIVFSVYIGDADAGFLRDTALNKVDAFVPPGAIRVLAETAWLPNWALSISREMVAADREKIVQAVRKLQKDDPVFKALHITSFRATNDQEYDTVRKAAGLAPHAAAEYPEISAEKSGL